MSKRTAPLDSHAVTRANRRTLILVLLLSTPLTLLALALLPNVGPILRIYNAPSTSMAPTLPVGSIFFVSRLSYGYSRHSFDIFELPMAGRWPAGMPARGDVIVFRLPRDKRTQYVKRVIGLPGDRVQLLQGRLWLNGRMVERTARARIPDPDPVSRRGALVATYTEDLPEGASYRIIEAQGDAAPFDTTIEHRVPPGHLFVLGDNRDNSTDSRMAREVGYVPVEMVVGRVVLVLGGR